MWSLVIADHVGYNYRNRLRLRFFWTQFYNSKMVIEFRHLDPLEDPRDPSKIGLHGRTICPFNR
jgi:hypothetical protein